MLQKYTMVVSNSNCFFAGLVENATVITDDGGKEVVCSSSTPYIITNPPTETSSGSQSEPSTSHSVSEGSKEDTQNKVLYMYIVFYSVNCAKLSFSVPLELSLPHLPTPSIQRARILVPLPPHLPSAPTPYITMAPSTTALATCTSSSWP